MIKVYENILKLRKSKGLSQLDIAEKLGINQDTYSKLERGKIQITIERMYQIAEILDVSIDDILYYEEGKPTRKALELEIRQLENANRNMQTTLNIYLRGTYLNENTREGGLLHEQYKELREDIRHKEYAPIKLNNSQDLKTSHNREVEISRKAFRKLLDMHPILEQALEYGLITESWIVGVWNMLNSKFGEM